MSLMSLYLNGGGGGSGGGGSGGGGSIAPSVPDDWEEDAESRADLLEASAAAAARHAAASHRWRRRRNPASNIEADQDFRFMPYDFWHMLGKYIYPETVATFGSICKDTYAVINQASFWVSLYRDFCLASSLPEHLQPECVLMRPRGLKAQTIRALFLSYPPFMARISLSNPSSHNRVPQHPSKLLQQTCLAAWQTRLSTKLWRISFKFCDEVKTPQVLWQTICDSSCDASSEDNNVDSSDSDENIFECASHSTFLTEQENLHNNPESDCTMLEITSPSYCHLLPDGVSAAGQKLQEVALTIGGKGLRFHKLTMKFVPMHKRSCNHGDVVTILIHCVQSLKIINWFHPNYEID